MVNSKQLYHNNILQKTLNFVYVPVTVKASRDLFMRMTEAEKRCNWHRSNSNKAEKDIYNILFPSYVPRYDEYQYIWMIVIWGFTPYPSIVFQPLYGDNY